MLPQVPAQGCHETACLLRLLHSFLRVLVHHDHGICQIPLVARSEKLDYIVIEVESVYGGGCHHKRNPEHHELQALGAEGLISESVTPLRYDSEISLCHFFRDFAYRDAV